MIWQELINVAQQMRRELHKTPELSWKEFQTSSYLKKRLDLLGIQWRECAGTGVVAHVAQRASGECIALRADMDGLLLAEATDAPWRSTIPGQMHGCGHDGHMAVLLAVAQWLKEYEELLPAPVTLIFQPAEEGGFGAREMIADGCLEGVKRIFGWHNWPSIPFGQVICPDGPVMAANASFEIIIKGRGGHASQPELCRDPVLAAAAVTLGLQQIVSRRLSPQLAGVLSVTSIDARSGETVIPENARLLGSIRMENTRDLGGVGSQIESIAKAIACGYGVEAEVIFSPRYPAVINDASEAARARTLFQQIMGSDWRHQTTAVPIMASEDFSYYLKQVPGAFALVGAGDDGAHAYSCHNCNYDFNDNLISPMVQMMIQVVGLPDPLR